MSSACLQRSIHLFQGVEVPLDIAINLSFVLCLSCTVAVGFLLSCHVYLILTNQVDPHDFEDSIARPSIAPTTETLLHRLPLSSTERWTDGNNRAKLMDRCEDSVRLK